MVFVFAALAEFAYVLFVKRKQALQNIPQNCWPNGANPDKILTCKVNEISNSLNGVDSEMTQCQGEQATEDLETRNAGFWTRKCAILHGLPLTTKIDFAGLILFYFSYVIVNLVYWIHVMNLVE